VRATGLPKTNYNIIVGFNDDLGGRKTVNRIRLG
jgi:hypothetical protein